MDSTEILPARIYSPAVRYGMISGVDSKFTANGGVENLIDIYTVRFDSAQLAKLDPRVTQLVNALDAFSKQNIGTQVDLGTLRIETEPNVRYIAPVLAYGLTDKITFAVGLPIVYYKNKLRLVQSASNVKDICNQISNKVGDVKTACEQLDFAVTDAAREKIAAQGFKPLQDRNETLFGDAQLVGLFKFYDQEGSSFLMRSTLGLPTGKKNDPDDLADIGYFGLTSYEPQLVYNWLPTRKLRLSAKAAYKMVFADKLDVRVPTSADDILPGLETKEKVRRNVGDTITVGTAATFNIYDAFSIAGGYEYARKGGDKYAGDRGTRYDFLSKDTNSVAHRLRAGIGYDTIGLYMRTKKFPPLKFDFEVSNTVAGVNTDRQLVNEFTFTMFF